MSYDRTEDGLSWVVALGIVTTTLAWLPATLAFAHLVSKPSAALLRGPAR
jgi:hypothetical protein